MEPHAILRVSREFLPLFIGPVFTREAVTSPRRPRFYVYRSVYVAVLLLLMCTAWLIVAGLQVVRNVGDMARFGSELFQRMAQFQLALVVFFSAIQAASAVALEKDRKTLILLLMSRLTNSELVLGRLLASVLNVLVMAAAALPVFMLIVLFGGVSFGQVGRVFLVTLVTGLLAGSVGSTLALWREKTFQTLAMTALAIALWVGFWEALGATSAVWAGIGAEDWSAVFSPAGAIQAAARPGLDRDSPLHFAGQGTLFVVLGLAAAGVLNGIAIWRVRVWNPSREVRMQRSDEVDGPPSIWGVEHELGAAAPTRAQVAETARSEHVDAQLRSGRRIARHRQVWDNPVLWRETRTWAYGRKILIVYFAYVVLSALAAAGLWWILNQGVTQPRDEVATTIPAAAWVVVPLAMVSLVIVNALAVTAITNERDGGSLDLLLATDLSPREFVLGKLGGVFWVTRLMVVLPILLCLYLWWIGGIGLENLTYLIGGLAVMFLFAATLGIHCGMIYASSRTAITVSLGMVFFLFLGVVTCLLMMISFSGSFQVQLAPFLAFIMGGAVGMYLALGARNPSAAIAAASIVAPFATFFAITSFLLGNRELTVFLVISGAYGFAVAAMLVPAIGEFDIAMGRTQGNEE
jgi:ABC-type transport system involved in multi-copper enzyme maturation permease subunit